MVILCIFIFQTTFIKIYQTPYIDGANCVEITPQNEYLLTGYLITGSKDVCLIKVDTSGEKIWEKVYGLPASNEIGHYIKRCEEGYIIVGEKDQNLYILRIDEDGNVLWERVYNGRIGYCVDKTSDGFIIGGSKVISGMHKMYLLKINENGDSIWSFEFSDPYLVNVWSIENVGDTIYLLSGYAEVPCMYFGSYALTLTLEGDTIWTRVYGGSNEPWPGGWDVKIASAHKTFDGNYIIGGWVIYHGKELYHSSWLEKIDPQGETQWSNSYLFAYIEWFETTQDSGYIMVGEIENNIYLIKVNNNGNMQWNRIYNIFYNSKAKHIKQTADGGYIIAGIADTSSNSNIFLIKTDAEGYVNIKEINKNKKRENASSILYIKNKNLEYLKNLYFYNVFGKKVKILKNIPSGTYFLSFEKNKRKILLLK